MAARANRTQWGRICLDQIKRNQAWLIPWGFGVLGFCMALAIGLRQNAINTQRPRAETTQTPAARTTPGDWDVPGHTSTPRSVPISATPVWQATPPDNQPRVLPLPPPSRPDPDLIAQSTLDDEPVVDDLAGRSGSDEAEP